MSVEFYSVHDKKRQTILFRLNDREFESLDLILKKFKKLTGLTIDQYGTTRISVSHVELLSGLIENDITNADKFVEIRRKLTTIRSDAVAIGD